MGAHSFQSPHWFKLVACGVPERGVAWQPSSRPPDNNLYHERRASERRQPGPLGLPLPLLPLPVRRLSNVIGIPTLRSSHALCGSLGEPARGRRVRAGLGAGQRQPGQRVHTSSLIVNTYHVCQILVGILVNYCIIIRHMVHSSRVKYCHTFLLNALSC